MEAKFPATVLSRSHADCIIGFMKDESSIDTPKESASPDLVGMMQNAIRHAQAGDTDQAGRQFRAILDLDPDNPDALHFLGIVKHQHGESEQAIELIRRSLSIAPGNPNAYNNLANVLKEVGENKAAIFYYGKALALDPGNAQTLNNLGVVLINLAEFEKAVEVLLTAIEAQPGLGEAHHNLGKALASCGRHEAARDAYRQSLNILGDWVDPVGIAQDYVSRGDIAEAELLLTGYLERNPGHSGAQFQLSALRGENVDIADEEYVTMEFDNFAPSFDAKLQSLEYRAPELVAAAVAKYLGEARADKEILDLGCGTGLAGPLIANFKSRLAGVDLSPKMMELARRRGCYDSLSRAELQHFMEEQPPASFDIAICVDTLVYIGALERTFAGAARILKPGGFFFATVEALLDGTQGDYVIDPVGRFKHSRSYLQRLADENGLAVLSMDDAVLRLENKVGVDGYVMGLQKPA